MKHTQLMIGSIVKLNNPRYWGQYLGRYFAIEAIKKNGDDYCVELRLLGDVTIADKVTGNLNQFLEFIGPVPLTPDLLLRCGFENGSISCGYSVNLGLDPNNCDNDEWNIFIKQHDGDTISDNVLLNTELKYLHELQRLILSLTGKELEVRI